MLLLSTLPVQEDVALIAKHLAAISAVHGRGIFTVARRHCMRSPTSTPTTRFLLRPPRDVYKQLLDRCGADGAARRARKLDLSVAGCAGDGHLGREHACIGEGNRVDASQEHLEKERETGAGEERKRNAN